jgi:hypothetical protein
MELDASDDDVMPPLVGVHDMGMMDWLRTTSLDPWTQGVQQRQQRQEQRQERQRRRHPDEDRIERLSLLNARVQLQPARTTGPRSRPSTRRTTGPQAARPAAWPVLPARQQQDTQDAAAGRSRRQIDALYASAVQQVWARTARLSADLLGWTPGSEAAGAGWEQQQLLQQRPQSAQRQQQQQQEEQQEYVQLQQVQQEPLSAEMCRAPASCSFLQPGLLFVGNQTLQRGSLQQEDQWSVQVTLHVSPARRTCPPS